MSRLHRSPLSLVLLLASSLGCRADDAACTEVAEHLARLAEAEGKGSAGITVAVERDCKEHRPTRKLLRCMLDAQSLTEVDAC